MKETSRFEIVCPECGSSLVLTGDMRLQVDGRLIIFCEKCDEKLKKEADKILKRNLKKSKYRIK